MMRSGLIIVSACVALVFGVVGCNSSGRQASKRELAYRLVQEANAALEKHQYQEARAKFSQAIDTGGLNVDIYINATIQRAICAATLGDFEAAYADLDRMEQGAPNLDVVYAARSFVLAKQGKKKEAKAVWAKARRFNRKVKPFGD